MRTPLAASIADFCHATHGHGGTVAPGPAPCRHFNGLAFGRCQAGVAYAQVMDQAATGLARFPCFPEGAHLPCPLRLMSTQEATWRPCPYCGTPCAADWVDNGVGLQQCGPYVCDACHAVQLSPWDEPGLTPATPQEQHTGWYAPPPPEEEALCP